MNDCLCILIHRKKLNDNYSVNLMVSMHEFNDNDYYEVNKK